MIQSIKMELSYAIKSHLLIKFILAIVLLFSLILYMNFKSVESSNLDFQTQLTFAEEVELELEKDYIVTSETGKSMEIENPLAYYNFQLDKYLFASSNHYRLSQLLESSTLVFPLVFGVLVSLLATIDFKYKTIKLKGGMFDRRTLAISKHIALLLLTVIILLSGLVISWFIGWLFNKDLQRTLSLASGLSEFSLKALPLKIIWTSFLALFFSELGYTLGYLSKSRTVSVIAIFSVFYLLPNYNLQLNYLDISASLKNISVMIYDYLGVIQPTDISDFSLFYSILAISFYVLLMLLLNYYVSKIRSNFQ